VSSAPSAFKRVLLISIPATVTVALVAAGCLEWWVRATADPRAGTPGLFLADASRGQRLAPNYSGWFAGVPVRINNLGFRDARDYRLDKDSRTFRILVLGDSVTFGHGSVYETTYPYLLERRLAAWRSDVNWQVWNLGIPGYNTGQELSQLLDVGSTFLPDLVVVGFFENDLDGNATTANPGLLTRAATVVRNAVEPRLYSIGWYKRVYLTLAWRLSRHTAFHDRLDNLAALEALALAAKARSVSDDQQRLTDGLSRRAEGSRPCPPGLDPESDRQATLLIDELRHTGRWDAWTGALEKFQDLHRDGRYRIVFFLNTAPEALEAEDLFCDAGTRRLNDYWLSLMARDTPAVSVYDEIGHYRPSQMPLAKGHSIGNTNRVKADVLFDYLKPRLIY